MTRLGNLSATRYALQMSRALRAVVLTLLFIGCGGRAKSEQLTPGAEPESAVGGSAGTHASVGDSGTATMAAAAQGGTVATASGGASAALGPLVVDDENTGGDRPTPPTDASVIWGSEQTGFHIGNWFWTSDRERDVGLSIIDPPRDGSTKAREVSGSGYATGVVLWLQLDHPLGRGIALSGYSALTFWARLYSESGMFDVALNDGARPPGSLDARLTLPTVALSASSSWQQFTVPLVDFKGVGDGIVSIEFHVGTGGEAFDLWIDDLGFR